MTLAQWEKVISVNLTGQFLCAREAIIEFLRRGIRPEISRSAGKIICMSSVHQKIPWGRTRQLRLIQGRHHDDDGNASRRRWRPPHTCQQHRSGRHSYADQHGGVGTKEAYDALMTLVPYGRIGEPDDIARAAVWLASDQADYVVGATLFVDGGMTLSPPSRRAAECV